MRIFVKWQIRFGEHRKTKMTENGTCPIFEWPKMEHVLYSNDRIWSMSYIRMTENRNVPFSLESVPYLTEYVTRVKYTFRAIYGPTNVKTVLVIDVIWRTSLNYILWSITCPSPSWVRIMLGSLDSFMWGNYPATLQNVGGSTQVLARAWNNARRGTWGLPPRWKLESRHITFTVLVQRWPLIK